MSEHKIEVVKEYKAVESENGKVSVSDGFVKVDVFESMSAAVDYLKCENDADEVFVDGLGQ